MSGMTDVTPAAWNALDDRAGPGRVGGGRRVGGWTAMVSTTGLVIPAWRRSGSRYSLRATWSLVAVADDDADPVRRSSSSPRSVAPRHHGGEDARTGRARSTTGRASPSAVQSVTVVHCPMNGVWPSWVTHSWLSPVHEPSPSSTANAGGLPSVHCLHRARMAASLVGSKLHDDRVDLAAVDAAPASLMSFTKVWMALPSGRRTRCRRRSRSSTPARSGSTPGTRR